MDDFVQMSLKKYDELKCELHRYKLLSESNAKKYNRYKKEKQSEIDVLKEYILERNCLLTNTKKSLEYYLDRDSYGYGMNYKRDMEKIGFTYDEMDEFIRKRYEEIEKEEIEDARNQ